MNLFLLLIHSTCIRFLCFCARIDKKRVDETDPLHNAERNKCLAIRQMWTISATYSDRNGSSTQEFHTKMGSWILLSLLICGAVAQQNPVFEGWYADPEGIIYNKTYWIFPTYSANYEEQIFFDAFSSSDFKTWTKHPRIIDSNEVTWANKAMWAPSVFTHEGKYYFLFGANDVHEGEVGGIGIAVADRPEGPYKDLLGRPLIQEIVNGAQPIDQFVFRDADGTYYMYYGGWGHCNIVKFNDDFTALAPLPDIAGYYKEVTPEGYVEGPFMFIRNGIYYFMWSEGGWTGPDYKVAYAKASSVFGPFVREGVILEQDPSIATGAGHHSVIQVPNTEQYFIVYHRRPLGDNDGNHRVTCIEEMKFDDQGNILPVKMTFEGVTAPILPPN